MATWRRSAPAGRDHLPLGEPSDAHGGTQPDGGHDRISLSYEVQPHRWRRLESERTVTSSQRDLTDR
jgi:hypothetical protein